jgi:hypothetical protein
MSFFHKKNVTKCMRHHYAIWASDSNILLAQTKFQALTVCFDTRIACCLLTSSVMVSVLSSSAVDRGFSMNR